MNARSSFLLSTVAVAVADSFVAPARAGDAADRLSRGDVKAAVLQARAAGELMRAGAGPFAVQPSRGTAARADVKAGVLQAMASGELMAAGDRPLAFAAATSTRTRGDVKVEVKQAQAAGQLLPAGERIAAFELATGPVRAYRDRAEMAAAARR
jgi:hypothetical protein